MWQVAVTRLRFGWLVECDEFSPQHTFTRRAAVRVARRWAYAIDRADEIAASILGS